MIGGNSLPCGIGTIRGTIRGAFLLSTIDDGMALLGVSSYAESIVKALILEFAVALDGYFTRRRVAKGVSPGNSSLAKGCRPNRCCTVRRGEPERLPVMRRRWAASWHRNHPGSSGTDPILYRHTE